MIRPPSFSLLLLLLLVSAAPAATDDESLRELVRDGLEALRAGDAERALILFRDAQVEAPEAPELHYDIGLALYRLERWDEARQAFEAAALAGDRALQTRARLWVGNCAVREGKWQAALEAFDRALELEPGNDDAAANRTYVLRKLRELARKREEQQQKQEEQRRFVERVRELVQDQSRAHLALRTLMVRKGAPPPPTRVTRLEELFDAPLGELPEPLPALAEDEEERFFSVALDAQTQALETLRGLIEEGRARAATAEPAPGAAGPGPAPQDPEAAMIRKALPHLEAAAPLLEDAAVAAEERRGAGLHAAQEGGLVELLRALDELLDELTRIIQDQIDLAKDGRELLARQRGEAEEPPHPEDELRDRSVEQGARQERLQQRTAAFAKGLESRLAEMRKAESPSPGTPVGGVPDDEAARFEAALGHLLAAVDAMDGARSELARAALEEALEHEGKALEELLKARAQLSPPSQQGSNSGESGDREREREESGEDQEKQPQEGGKKEGSGSPGEGAQESSEGEGEDRRLSEEQASTMLERARQRERDRRRAARDEGRRAAAGGGGAARDW